MSDKDQIIGGVFQSLPLVIDGVREQTFSGGGGGGYVGNGSGWGLNDGPHRGTGGGTINEIALPNLMEELMNEHNGYKAAIDIRFDARFNTLFTDTERELEERKQAAKATEILSVIESSIIDQKVTLDFIFSKKRHYAAVTPTLYGLYGQSPYFLMEVLPRKMMNEFWRSPEPNPENLAALYKMFDDTYEAALELKFLSLSTDVLSAKLSGLADQVSQAQAGANGAAEPRLDIIAQERDIHFQQLPDFLQAEVVAAVGSLEDMTPFQALSHHKAMLEHIASTKIAEMKPVVGPPPYVFNGIVFTVPVTNPKINAPLSKPELAALSELVYLQNNTTVGVKWLSYHDALLKSESARHLTATANAFSGLIERARQAEQIIEANRIADEVASAAAAEAEAQRLAAEAAEQARIDAQVANTFKLPGHLAAATAFITTPAGIVAVAESSAVALRAAIRAAIAALANLAAGTASGLLVGVSALVYSPKLANGELPERFSLATPLFDLLPEHSHDLPAIAAADGTVDLPFRLTSKTAADGQSEVIVVQTDGAVVQSKVRVVAAKFNPEQNVYSVTTGDVPPRTVTWTPIVSPGNSSTTWPAEQTDFPVYTGASVTPIAGRVDKFPAVVEAGFDDFITVFPADSGLAPIYVMFRDRREDPGSVGGAGQPILGVWLGAAAQGDGAFIPSQIADQIRGKEFKNFKAFREALWKAVATDVELSNQFISTNRALMLAGKAPKSRKVDSAGKRNSFEIHHVDEVARGGAVYDVDNMRILTAKRHVEIHKGDR